MGSSDLVPNRIFYRVSRRMDQLQAQRPSVEALLLDGAAMVNMLKPGASKTIQEYSETVFLPYVNKPVKECREGGCGMGQISPRTVLKILHEAREERVSVDASDWTPGSQEIGQPS